MSVLIVWILLIIIVFALAKASKDYKYYLTNLLKKNKNGGNTN